MTLTELAKLVNLYLYFNETSINSSDSLNLTYRKYKWSTLWIDLGLNHKTDNKPTNTIFTAM